MRLFVEIRLIWRDEIFHLTQSTRYDNYFVLASFTLFLALVLFVVFDEWSATHFETITVFWALHPILSHRWFDCVLLSFYCVPITKFAVTTHTTYIPPCNQSWNVTTTTHLTTRTIHVMSQPFYPTTRESYNQRVALPCSHTSHVTNANVII